MDQVVFALVDALPQEMVNERKTAGANRALRVGLHRWIGRASKLEGLSPVSIAGIDAVGSGGASSIIEYVWGGMAVVSRGRA
jgi:hypothetical protein